MPRKEKGARLLWRDRSGEGRDSFWEIRDGRTRLSTGTDDRQLAEEKLALYIGEKYRPIGPVSSQEMTVADCLVVYGEEHAPHVAAPWRLGYAIEALLPFWGSRKVSEISGSTCRAYNKSRITKRGPASAGTIRRELNVLQAAINFCFKEGKLTSPAKVTLPEKPAQADRLRAVTGAQEPDAVTLGGAAGPAGFEFLDRCAGQAETGLRARPAAVLQAGRLCRAARPDQAARRSGRVLPRQGPDVEVDRREPVTSISQRMACWRPDHRRISSA